MTASTAARPRAPGRRPCSNPFRDSSTERLTFARLWDSDGD